MLRPALFPRHGIHGMENESLECGPLNNEDTHLKMRIASIFIILATSSSGALFPVIASRVKYLSVHKGVFDAAKYFGSGVIIATAFIHLLTPAFEQLGSPCLTGVWADYSWAPALAMISVFLVFFVEMAAFRWGTAKLDALGAKAYDTHGHAQEGAGRHGAHGPETSIPPPTNTLSNPEKMSVESDPELGRPKMVLTDSALAQILGVVILEFGVVFHSVLIGMTLAVDADFTVLFVVLIFHQMFEGLGLGTRLATLELPPAYKSWVPFAGAALYGCTTPIGIAAGLGIRSSYNPGSATSSIVGGIFDSLSAGILLYTGLVE
ncbi:high-affinity Zn(2+) transporter zrt1, partial [Ceratobasidium sp. 395]